MLKGRAREMGLGALALYGLKEARAKALEARRLRQRWHRSHRDQERRADEGAGRSAKAITFKQCAEAFIKAHRAG
jgi:hypothetical protein